MTNKPKETEGLKGKGSKQGIETNLDKGQV